jgi:phospholipase C
MTCRSVCGTIGAAALLAAMLHNAACSDPVAALSPAGATTSRGAAQYRPVAATLTATQKWQLLREKIRYVFVIFQENRSFDHYFGTYPGADGLFRDGARIPVPGSVQRIRNTDGSYADIAPFLIPRTITDAHGTAVPLYPEDTATVDHSHRGMLHGLHLDGATQRLARNDGYALAQQRLHYAGDAASDATVVDATGAPPAANPTLIEKQMGELAMAHLDCDTVPFLWQFADRFALFDDFHQTTIGPSTPNAIALIAGQSGETQWALHPQQGDPTGLTVPNATDSGPFAGGPADKSADPLPYGPNRSWLKPQRSLTFATLPLAFLGGAVTDVVGADPDPNTDLADLHADIPTIAARNPAVPWGWYQQGLGAEPFDGTTTADGVPHPPHGAYIVHHNGPQYFAYLGTNPRIRGQLHGLQDFFETVAARHLPEQGGVFYVRGGFYNNDGLVTLDPSPAVRRKFAGNDDHPGYADAQISEALVADAVDAVAASPYWAQSAIIVTYDETDGLYDHALPRIRARGPDGQALVGGPRIPAILISPYAAAHTVAHAYAEHSSVIRFIDLLFGLVPLADLPDEQRGRALGRSQAETFQQPDLGPADDLVAPMSDLADAFDNDRLAGTAAPLPPDYAIIPEPTIRALPHYNGAGCSALHITPTDYRNGVAIDPPPPDFNPRPALTPGVPSAGGWTP